MARNNFKKKTLSEILAANNVLKLIKDGKRIDGRGLLDYRDIKIETGVVKKAFGSAKVQLGDTIVVVGIFFELGTPFSDTPDKGILLTEGEVLPTASFGAEAGPPGEDEIEISRVVDRSIRESEMIDLSKLVIRPGETVLKLFIDFNIFNDDGNIIDAAVLGTVSALLTGSMPDPSYIAEHLDEVQPHYLKPLPQIPIPVNDIPIANTVALIGDKFIVDPNSAEELVANARICITHTADNKICSIQLIEGGLSYEHVFDSLNIALDKSKELRTLLSKQLGLKS
jgi:exosome complex component RRP42